MSYEELAKLQEDYSYCVDCNHNHSIGQGRVDAVGLLIVPSSVSLDKEFPSVYPNFSKEMGILSMIFEKTELHIDDWYITPTVECSKKSSKQDVLDSNERLKKVLYTISPQVVVLAGSQSYYAFFGSYDKSIEYGPIECSNYKVFYTHDLSKYIKDKLDNSDTCNETAKTIFNIWSKIAICLKNCLTV
jgi:hypothetical protein